MIGILEIQVPRMAKTKPNQSTTVREILSIEVNRMAKTQPNQ